MNSDVLLSIHVLIYIYSMYILSIYVLIHVNYIKDGLSLEINKIHIHLYFIAIQYLWKYAFVEDIDN